MGMGYYYMGHKPYLDMGKLVFLEKITDVFCSNHSSFKIYMNQLKNLRFDNFIFQKENALCYVLANTIIIFIKTISTFKGSCSVTIPQYY